LTIAESHFCWTGGSVSGVIWLFRELVNRQADKQLLDNLSAWILANTNNPYNPFGTRVSLGAKDYSDYLARSRSRSNQIANLVLTDKQLEASAAEERRIRRIRSQAGAIARNTEARSEIIAALNLMSIEEKLDRIARDPEYPPQFFPTRIANAASQSIISALPLDVRLQLARRLKGKRRGPWGEFKKRLYASIGPVWNKSAWGV
jgi:multidrug efflux pump subunit AcrA (membrane-fusion protein)